MQSSSLAKTHFNGRKVLLDILIIKFKTNPRALVHLILDDSDITTGYFFFISNKVLVFKICNHPLY